MKRNELALLCALALPSLPVLAEYNQASISQDGAANSAAAVTQQSFATLADIIQTGGSNRATIDQAHDYIYFATIHQSGAGNTGEIHAQGVRSNSYHYDTGAVIDTSGSGNSASIRQVDVADVMATITQTGRDSYATVEQTRPAWGGGGGWATVTQTLGMGDTARITQAGAALFAPITQSGTRWAAAEITQLGSINHATIDQANSSHIFAQIEIHSTYGSAVITQINGSHFANARVAQHANDGRATVYQDNAAESTAHIDQDGRRGTSASVVQSAEFNDAYVYQGDDGMLRHPGTQLCGNIAGRLRMGQRYRPPNGPRGKLRLHSTTTVTAWAGGSGLDEFGPAEFPVSPSRRFELSEETAKPLPSIVPHRFILSADGASPPSNNNGIPNRERIRRTL